MNLLWKKESRHFELYVDIFKNIPAEDHVLVSKIKSVQKSKSKFISQTNDKFSYVLGSSVNKKMRDKNWLEGNLCNGSVRHAKIGSENVFNAYVNRSLNFFNLKMHKECIADIELTKQTNHPTHWMAKLDKQLENCWKLIKTENGIADVEPKLDYEADERFPGLANVLEIKCNSEFGRYIIAKCNIPAGQTVLVEEALTAQSRDNLSCKNCLKIPKNFIACSQCTKAIFCNSASCTNASDVHTMECDDNWVETKFPRIEFFMHLMFSVLKIFPNIESFMRFVEDAVNEKNLTVPESLEDMKSKYRALLQLNVFLSEQNENICLRTAYVTYSSLMLRKSIKMIFKTNHQKRFLMHLVLHHNYVHSSNAFDSMDGRICEFIISSYFNHACASNVVGRSTGNLRYIITTRPIKKGQQLFVNYMGYFKPVAECQTYLSENFGFQCNCERCKPDHNLCGSTLTDFQSDDDYKYLIEEYEKLPNYGYEEKNEKLKTLQNKIIDVLNRFGDRHWCDELENLIDKFENLNEIAMENIDVLPQTISCTDRCKVFFCFFVMPSIAFFCILFFSS